MVENLSSTEEYKDFELKHNRYLNMLQDNVGSDYEADLIRNA